MNLLLIILLVLLFAGSGWGFHAGWSYGNGGIVGVIVLLIVLHLLGLF